MIDDLMTLTVEVRREIVFRDRDANAIGESLSEWTGRRLHARCQSAFGMSWCDTAPLAELFDLFQRQIVTRQMQQAIEQHRTVSG